MADRAHPAAAATGQRFGPCGKQQANLGSAPPISPEAPDPDLADKVNAAWLRMVSEHGLLNADCEFLIACQEWMEQGQPTAAVRERTEGELGMDMSGSAKPTRCGSGDR
ncbi:hypothetical protein GCM10009839_33160 [Catenulispora yoronensis]|uniref:Uncharacterized protein n=1 Tax=Catenulispora yoronensis TaxID=450799 RepID=A0ABP5FNE8_9ACTN